LPVAYWAKKGKKKKKRIAASLLSSLLQSVMDW